MKRYTLIFASLTLLTGFVLTGCDKPSDSPATSAQPASPAQQKPANGGAKAAAGIAPAGARTAPKIDAPQ